MISEKFVHMQSAMADLPESLQALTDRTWQRIIDIGEGVDAAEQWSPEDCGIFMRMIACSDYAAGVVQRHWTWFQESVAAGLFNKPPRFGFLPLEEGVDEIQIKKAIRVYRHQQMVHMLWREYSGAAALYETLENLSRLADELLLVARDAAVAALAPRLGSPVNDNGNVIPFVILTMGKLGGSELNFSSDADVIFLYSEDGNTDGPRSLSAHEYFTRLARRLVNLLDDVTEDNFAYRIDTRLRPFGDSGPPVVSFMSLESYLLKHGRSWERYAYVKARAIGIRKGGSVDQDLTENLIHPFVYRRYLDYSVFESLRDMKAMITAEVQKREMANNIKLGPGGIREIEFIVQSLQLVRGGQNENLRCRELNTAIHELVRIRSLREESASTLLAAYGFLRRLENFIQAIRDQQTHDMPGNDTDRQRLTLAMGFPSFDELLAELERHRGNVSDCFQDVVFRSDTVGDSGVRDVQLALDIGTAEGWSNTLAEHGHANGDELSDVLVRFSALSSVRRIDSDARKRLVQFIPMLLRQVRDVGNVAETVSRVLAIAEKVLRRSAYLALLIENPAVLQRVVSLCTQSAYFADEIARYPLLLDEMLDPRIFTAVATLDDMRLDANERLRQVDPNDSERQIDILSQFQRASKFRIAISEMSGSLPIMKVSDALSDLAEVVLCNALDIAWRDLVALYGEPHFTLNKQQRRAEFGVVAYGKLGGMELSYGSDLDLVFLHNSQGENQQTAGSKPLDNSMFFQRLVRRLVHFLTTQTSSGALYEVDTRLRPSGRSGLLVSSTEAFERYQEENAWTWEHQALLRSRPVAGSVAIRREFDRIRTETLRRRVNRQTLSVEIVKMRARMRQQLDRSTAQQFDLKQGLGGIGDLEFIVQYLALFHADHNAAVIFYPDNIRQLGTLAAAGLLEESVVSQLQSIYRDYRTSAHRLALDSRPPIIEDAEFREERKFVADLWQRVLG